MKLNKDPEQPKPGQPVTVIGFGFTEEDGEISEQLQEVEVETIGYLVCNFQLPGVIFRQSHVCAGIEEGGRDSCNGDSGGPLLDSKTMIQYGLATFGVGCAR